MLDVVGTSLTVDDIRRIQQPLTGGVVMFTRNYQDRMQLTALTMVIHAARPGTRQQLSLGPPWPARCAPVASICRLRRFWI